MSKPGPVFSPLAHLEVSSGKREAERKLLLLVSSAQAQVTVEQTYQIPQTKFGTSELRDA